MEEVEEERWMNEKEERGRERGLFGIEENRLGVEENGCEGG